MKIYKGKRIHPKDGYISAIKVTVDGKPLRDHVYHSPDGFNWGYGGSGPADLARSILWDYLGVKPTKGFVYSFKCDFVSGWKDKWEVSSKEIQDWIDTGGKI